MRLRFIIPTDFAAVREVQRRILDEAARLGFDEQSLFAIKLALEEALINAVKHGNRMDAAKHIRVRAELTPACARISIEDEGAGFDRRRVPDPRLEENLERCSGRGILLIEAYMNRVQWRKGGRCVCMTKYNDDEAPQA